MVPANKGYLGLNCALFGAVACMAGGSIRPYDDKDSRLTSLQCCKRACPQEPGHPNSA